MFEFIMLSGFFYAATCYLPVDWFKTKKHRRESTVNKKRIAKQKRNKSKDSGKLNQRTHRSIYMSAA